MRTMLLTVIVGLPLVIAAPAADAQGCGGSGAAGGMCGMMQPAQAQAPNTSSAMQGMSMPAQGMMQGGCPMMKQMASLQERVRQMEDKMGMKPAPSAPPMPGMEAPKQ